MLTSVPIKFIISRPMLTGSSGLGSNWGQTFLVFSELFLHFTYPVDHPYLSQICLLSIDTNVIPMYYTPQLTQVFLLKSLQIQHFFDFQFLTFYHTCNERFVPFLREIWIILFFIHISATRKRSQGLRDRHYPRDRFPFFD